MLPWFERPIIYDIRARPYLVESTTGSHDLQMVRYVFLVLLSILCVCVCLSYYPGRVLILNAVAEWEAIDHTLLDIPSFKIMLRSLNAV